MYPSTNQNPRIVTLGILWAQGSIKGSCVPVLIWNRPVMKVGHCYYGIQLIYFVIVVIHADLLQLIRGQPDF